MAATAPKAVPSSVPGEPAIPVIDIDEHQADLARLRVEQEANREEMIKCLNPVYASAREMEKPYFRFTVSAKWLGRDEQGRLASLQSEQVVVAQNEADAWAMFCDEIEVYPSRRDAKPTINRGRQVSLEIVAASRLTDMDADSSLPTVTIGPKPKRRKI